MGRLELLRVDELPLGKRPLFLGTKGRDVRELQAVLKEMKILDLEPSGEYDYLTMNAVKSFQRSFNIYPDGITGLQTLKMLKEPGIKDRIYLQLKKGDKPVDLGLNQQMGLSAFKRIEGRRRIKRAYTNEEVMIEKREVWAIVPEINEDYNLDQCYTGLLLIGNEKVIKEQKESNKKITTLNKKEIRILPLYSVDIKKNMGVDSVNIQNRYIERGWVYDLRDHKRVSKKTRKSLITRARKARKENLMKGGLSNPPLVFWWLSSPGGNYMNLPDDGEADGIIVSPVISVEETFSHRNWYAQVKKLLRIYPCTRILLHFNLQGLEKTNQGEISLLSACDSKALRISHSVSARISRQRLGEDGWIFVRYKRNEEERSALIPDMRTFRGILSRVDRLNLAGIVITGADLLSDKIRNEVNRFFMVSPRGWVINEKTKGIT